MCLTHKFTNFHHVVINICRAGRLSQSLARLADKFLTQFCAQSIYANSMVLSNLHMPKCQHWIWHIFIFLERNNTYMSLTLFLALFWHQGSQCGLAVSHSKYSYIKARKSVKFEHISPTVLKIVTIDHAILHKCTAEIVYFVQCIFKLPGLEAFQMYWTPIETHGIRQRPSEILDI